MESYRILDSTDVTASGRAPTPLAPINAVSWGFDRLTLAAAVEVWDDLVRLRVEYAFVLEYNAVVPTPQGDRRLRGQTRAGACDVAPSARTEVAPRGPRAASGGFRPPPVAGKE